MKRIFAMMCAAALILSGCGSKKESASTSLDKLTSYPIETEETLTYFKSIPSNLSGSVANYSETEFAKEFDKATGVEIKYIHPGAGQFNEAFNLMLASDELPDIIDASWFYEYPGGPGKAISDGVIIPLNDYKEYAPAYFSYLEANPELDKHAKTDEGDYYGFPLIMESERMLITTGPTVREDWLKDLGMSAPETVEEWETMLTRFKNEKGATAPLSFRYANETIAQYFFAVLGTRTEFYVDGSQIKYGAVEPEYKEALIIANRWFKNGLLDPNFVSAEDKMISSQILGGKTGASFLSGGREIGQFLSDGVKPSKEFNLQAISFPGETKGEKNSNVGVYTRMNSQSSAITTQCKNPALAAKVLDYAYTKEGMILTNFGIEGKTYTVKDDVPTYTEEITKNPEGLAMSQALGKYVRAGGGGGAYLNMEEYLNQYYALPQQKAALTAWSTLSPDAAKATLPWALTPSIEESGEFARIMNEVNKYQAQMTVKFITGVEPIDKFDEYVETMNEYGLAKAVKIKEAQYKRFQNR